MNTLLKDHPLEFQLSMELETSPSSFNNSLDEETVFSYFNDFHTDGIQTPSRLNTFTDRDSFGSQDWECDIYYTDQEIKKVLLCTFTKSAKEPNQLIKPQNKTRKRSSKDKKKSTFLRAQFDTIENEFKIILNQTRKNKKLYKSKTRTAKFRKIKKHLRRLKEKMYRERLKQAFQFESEIITPLNKLPTKIIKRSILKTGKFSTFPKHFESMVLKVKTSLNKTNSSSAGLLQRFDCNHNRHVTTIHNEQTSPVGGLYAEMCSVISKSTKVNINGACVVSNLWRALKEIGGLSNNQTEKYRTSSGI